MVAAILPVWFQVALIQACQKWSAQVDFHTMAMSGKWDPGHTLWYDFLAITFPHHAMEAQSGSQKCKL